MYTDDVISPTHFTNSSFPVIEMFECREGSVMAWLVVMTAALVITQVVSSDMLVSPDASTKQGSRSLNVLGLSFPAMGHINPILALAEELVFRGHNVTLCIGIDDDNNLKLKKKIEKYGVNYCRTESNILKEVENANRKQVSFFQLFSIMRRHFADYSSDVMSHINQSLSDGLYDVVIGTDMTIPLLTCIDSHFKIPSILLSGTHQIHPHLNPPWAWPSLFVGFTSDDLSFIQRLISKVVSVTLPRLLSAAVVSPTKAAIEKFCPAPSAHDLYISVGVRYPYIVPSVIGFEYPRTITPMTELVGPLVFRSPDPLSGKMLEWLETKPRRSVVYVSMGSVTFLDEVNGKAVLEGVLKTNYSLLWSLRKSNQWILEGLDLDPNRVFISDWTPQFSVLGSRAIHSAILHGGYNGIADALVNGVPIIFFSEMPERVYNGARVHFNRLGIKLDMALTSSKIAGAIAAVNEGEYRQRISKLQKMFKFAGGVKRAADLVEFYEEVGYAHLVPAYAKYGWSWVQYYNADVYAAMAVILVVITMSLVTCLKCFYRKCCRTKEKAKND